MAKPTSPFVIVADDDNDVARMMEAQLKSWNFKVVSAAKAGQLFQWLDQEPPQALLLDLHFGDANGLEVLKQVVQKFPDIPVVMLTGHGSIESAVTAIKLGAYDYLTKPPDWPRMRLVLEHAAERQGLNARINQLEQLVDDPSAADRLWGDSPAMRRVKSLVASVAPTDATVLVLGETGAGKELIARALHDQSQRHSGPFVPLNMAALPRDLIESTLFGHEKGAFTGALNTRLGCCEAATGGTLFLDEIGEMHLSLQAKLLRFLQERTITRIGSNVSLPVDVRVVAATNRNLLDLVRQGQFREDLFYRLNVVPVLLPPLRERREDIPLLAARFLQRFASRYHKPLQGFTPQAMEILAHCNWPGNIRQLENLVEQLVILSKGHCIGADELPSDIPSNPRSMASIELQSVATTSSGPFSALPAAAPGIRRIDEVEKEVIFEALRHMEGNVRATARTLGLSPATVYRKIKQYNISLELVPQSGSPCATFDSG